MDYLKFVLIGYLSGSILYAYWVPKLLHHVDVTKESEDKNPGTANAFMYGGIGCGIIVLCLELLKAMLPVYYGARSLDINDIKFAFVFIAPVLGHAFPVFMRGKGGKSIAAAFGVLLGLLPDIKPVLWLAFFYLLFSLILVIKPHFYRSIFTFVMFQIAMLLTIEVNSIRIGCFLVGVIVIHKHLIKYHGEELQIHLRMWRKKRWRMEEVYRKGS